MDKNAAALAHCTCALLAALCRTHPQPDALLAAFNWHLEFANEELKTSATSDLVKAWADTFRLHIEAARPEPSQ